MSETPHHRVEWRHDGDCIYGRFICDADPNAECHQYPACEHERWPCDCPIVRHDTCWQLPWMNDAVTMEELYDGPPDVPVHDGPVATIWDSGCDGLVWRYADTEEAKP